MKSWKDLFSRLLNPRSSLKNIPSFSGSEKKSENSELSTTLGGSRRGGLKLRYIYLNMPLMLGLIIVVGLFLMVLFGPVWAPFNPYIAGQHIVPHYDFELKEFIRPPLEPSDVYPLGTDQWGTDILSLLMHGTRNTLIASAFITMVRVFLGLLLGAAAGWNEGKTSDRLIMGLIGMVASLPLLNQYDDSHLRSGY